ncbi:MAG: ornithine cyclodeaminase family protein [Anaerolineae bacterium]|nr:ornithine cyclodeaminase family protein [Anaerolineae bacterium]
MELLILNAAQVRQLLPMAACMDVMAAALQALGRGEMQNPLRTFTWLPDKRGLLVAMPAIAPDVMGIKVISVMPGNTNTEYESHMGAVMIFDTTYGRPLALMDASEITTSRTAAVSGVATRLLAREDASDLAILGTGVQAISHLEAMLVARPIKRVRVWSRHRENREKFAAQTQTRFGIAVELTETAQDAVLGADIICTTTSSNQPVLQGAWLSDGVHLNVVGASTRQAREVDTATMVKARLFADRRESVLNEAGDFLIPKQEGAVDDSHIRGEIGEILLGEIPGRQSRTEITLFKSLGLAVEDLASAHYIYHQAVQQGIGTAVELGSTRY